MFLQRPRFAEGPRAKLFLKASDGVGGEWSVVRDVMGQGDELLKCCQASAVVDAQMNAPGMAGGDNGSEYFGSGTAAALTQDGSSNCGPTAVLGSFAQLV